MLTAILDRRRRCFGIVLMGASILAVPRFNADKRKQESFVADAAMVAIPYDDYNGGGATDLQTSFGTNRCWPI